MLQNNTSHSAKAGTQRAPATRQQLGGTLTSGKF